MVRVGGEMGLEQKVGFGICIDVMMQVYISCSVSHRLSILLLSNMKILHEATFVLNSIR